ncbi:hypothetical protein P5E85_02255 [Clostridium perfringens]|nr:hypothetical protein [Clostridium perfringens]MDM0446291.1 hypothetical protein [Clostridium perfringens]
MEKIGKIEPKNIDEAKCECLKLFIMSLGYEYRETELVDGGILYTFLKAGTNEVVAKSAVKTSFEVYTNAFESK